MTQSNPESASQPLSQTLETSSSTSTSASPPRRFARPAPKPSKYKSWQKNELNRAALNALGQKMGFKEGDMEAWYKITAKDLRKHGVGSLFVRHGSSILRLLTATFPEHAWDPAKFGVLPRNHLISLDNQRRILSDVAIKLGIAEGEFEAWYKVSPLALKRSGGKALFVAHKGSMISLLRTVFPAYPWDIAKLKSKRPRGFWGSVENQRDFIQELGLKAFGIKEGDYESWYKVGFEEMRKNGGGSVLRYHNNSPASLLSAVFPEHEWHYWRFPKSRIPPLKELEYYTELVKFIESKFGLKADSDWYRVSEEVLKGLGVDKAVLAVGSLAALLQRVYPEKAWDPQRLNFSDSNKSL